MCSAIRDGHVPGRTTVVAEATARGRCHCWRAALPLRQEHTHTSTPMRAARARTAESALK
eukprot:scaffold2674_cov333-Prasinococcus_capsulatus_cf.AAC.6